MFGRLIRFGLGGLTLLAVRRLIVSWGGTKAECGAGLPGGESVPDPSKTTSCATIGAPEAVWPWLVQIGQDRARFYRDERIENAVGLHVRVRLAPAGWLGRPDGATLPVALIKPGRDLVLRESPPELAWDC